jgi:hypothetical protein
MAVPAGALNYVKPTPTIFELEALEGLPCGCVAAAYRARPPSEFDDDETDE